jgi:hypothetical protein
MKIEITQGCTAYGITFDGERLEYLSLEQQDKIKKYLLEKLSFAIDRGECTLEQLIRCFQYDSYETSDYKCEQCGDYVSTEIYEI